MNEFITIAAYTDVARSEAARAALEGHGIPVQFTDSEIVTEEWLQANAVGRVKLQVREQDAERAAELLGDRADLAAGLTADRISDDELERQALAEEPEGE